MKLKARLDSFFAYRHLMQQLVEKDVKLKYRRSFFYTVIEQYVLESCEISKKLCTKEIIVNLKLIISI